MKNLNISRANEQRHTSTPSTKIKRLVPLQNGQYIPRLPSLKKKFLAIPTNEGDVIVPRNQIMWLKAEGNYTKIALTKDRSFLLTKGIGQLHKKLSDERFIFCHQSHVINIEYVSRIIDKRMILLSDNSITHQVPVSRRKTSLLFQYILKL